MTGRKWFISSGQERVEKAVRPTQQTRKKTRANVAPMTRSRSRWGGEEEEEEVADSAAVGSEAAAAVAKTAEASLSCLASSSSGLRSWVKHET